MSLLAITLSPGLTAGLSVLAVFALVVIAIRMTSTPPPH